MDSYTPKQAFINVFDEDLFNKGKETIKTEITSVILACNNLSVTDIN